MRMPRIRKTSADALRKLGLLEESSVSTTSGAAPETQEQPAPSASRRFDTSWVLHLKLVSEAASHELSVQVLSARLLEAYDTTDRDAALFELESDRGLIRAILSRSGQYTFFWKR
jgi:hypothetical protein